MTTLSAVGPTSAASAPVTQSTADAAKANLDYDAFLKLLVAQMQNQDPLNPTDATEQLSQLASFSNVEQSIKVNQKLEAMITLSSLGQADAVLGKTVTSADGSVSGTVKSVRVYADGVVATLTDGRQLPIGPGIKVE